MRTVRTARRARNGRGAISAGMLTTLACAAGIFVPMSRADPPSDGDLIQPLPVVVPTQSDWEPQFPFPYNQTRASVTDADVNAEREMCQWYDAQYDVLKRQIDRVQFNRITPNGPGVINGSGSDWDFGVGDVQRQVDIVTANVDQSVAFLAPRAQALTQTKNFYGDNYFPLFQGESFFHLWQYLDAVNNGIKAHQPDWFTGPAVQRAKDWGSKINRSHVCR
jgi:hypothetical protein